MKTQNIIKSLTVASIILLASQMVAAQGVGNLGSLPTVFPNLGGGWDIVDSAGGPIPVVRDPNGPKWIKNLIDPNGNINAFPGQTFNVHEMLVVAPNLSWTDWHEDILTPGWEWTQNYLIQANWAPPTNLSVTNTPGTLTQGGSLSFLFDSLPPGTIVDIRKELVYTGPAGIAYPSIDIAQYPTPEPATLSLLAMGGIVLLRRRQSTRRPG